MDAKDGTRAAESRSALARNRRTGYVYDKEMEKHECAWDPLHIETPERKRAIGKRMKEVASAPLDDVIMIPSRKATREELERAHSPSLVQAVMDASAGEPEENYHHHKKFSETFDAVYLNEHSWDCALLAAGSTVDLVDAVYCGSVDNGMAIVRPPGHHACRTESNGFCLFNNVAVAAKNLLETRGAERILIVDWDVHHGQGTQRIFQDDPRVLFFSIHVYEEGGQWPGLREGNFDCVGTGKGAGYNVCMPLNKTGLEDVDYMAIFLQVLLPVAFEEKDGSRWTALPWLWDSVSLGLTLVMLQFNPEIVIVSAGYDAAIGCPEGHMRVTPAMYGHMTNLLMSLAGGKVAVVLEGGYCLESLAEGATCTLESLLGNPPCALPPLGTPDPLVATSILNVISALRPFWKSLAFQETEKSVSPSASLPVHQPRITFRGSYDAPVPEAYVRTPWYTPAETVELRYEIRSLKQSYDNFRGSLLRLNRTCYAYDEVMLGHDVAVDEHPEATDRIRAIHEHLMAVDLLQQCTRVEVRSATKSELLLAHSEQYAETLMLNPDEFAAKANRNIFQQKWSGDMVAKPGTQPAILAAAGALLNIVDCVMEGVCLNGFANTRPPGHHAHKNRPNGFCYANNVAIAATYAMDKYHLQRILIVDWDVHHGDGLQEAFYDDPRILYISLHRGDPQFYPEGAGKGAKNTGSGAGLGYNVNIPWSAEGAGDGDYVAAFLQVVMPLAYEFNPELVLVSCGFDAALGDPLGHCRVTEAGYEVMTNLLMGLAGGKLVLALEGGYHLEMISRCAEAVMKTLLGYPVRPSTGSSVPSPRAVRDIKHVLDIHSQSKHRWNSLQYRVVLLEPVDETDAGNGETSSAKAHWLWLEDLSEAIDSFASVKL